MRAKAIPVAEKSVFKKIGLSRSKRARQGEEVISVFNWKNRSRRPGVQYAGGMRAVLGELRMRAQKGLSVTSNQGQ